MAWPTVNRCPAMSTRHDNPEHVHKPRHRFRVSYNESIFMARSVLIMILTRFTLAVSLLCQKSLMAIELRN